MSIKEAFKKQKLLIKDGNGYKATQDFKNFVKIAIKHGGYEHDYLYNNLYDFDKGSYESALDSNWTIEHGTTLSREDYNDFADNSGIHYDYTLYVNGKEFDYVSSQLIFDFVYSDKELVEEEGEEEASLEPLSKDEIIKYFAENDGENPLDIFGDDLFSDYTYLIDIDDYDYLNLIHLVQGSKSNDSSTSFSTSFLKNHPKAYLYFKSILKKDFERHRDMINYTVDESDIENTRSLSKEFLAGLFTGNISEFFYYYDYNAPLSTYDIDYINEENIKKLNDLGFSKEFIKKIADKEDDIENDESMFKYVDSLKKILVRAASSATAVGSEAEAFSSFNYALNKALPYGCVINNDPEYWSGKRVTITEKFIDKEENVYAIWEAINDGYYELPEMVITAFTYLFNEKFTLYEPRNGWYGFSKDQYNNEIGELIPELEEEISGKNKEEALKSDAKLNREGKTQMNEKYRKLLEARADRDRFKAWAGEDLFNRFMKIKERLTSPENDMGYWSSTRNPHNVAELAAVILNKEKEIEKKDKENKLVEEGAELIHEDSNWYVYHITNFQACQKYGKNTRWCITGSDGEDENAYGNRHWISYTRDGNDFYFFIEKSTNVKYAVMLHPDFENDGGYTIFNPRDREISYIEGAPQVKGLPDVSESNPNFEDDEENEEENEDQEPAGPPVPPPFNLEPVQNPNAMEFSAATLEDALNRFSGVYGETALKVGDLRQDLFTISLGNGKFTIFVFNGTAGGPLMTQRGPGQFSLVTFDNLEVLTTWFQANMANVQVQNQADANQQPEPANEAVKEPYHEGIRLIYKAKKEEIKEAIAVDSEPEPVMYKPANDYFRMRLFKVK